MYIAQEEGQNNPLGKFRLLFKVPEKKILKGFTLYWHGGHLGCHLGHVT